MTILKQTLIYSEYNRQFECEVNQKNQSATDIILLLLLDSLVFVYPATAYSGRVVKLRNLLRYRYLFN